MKKSLGIIIIIFIVIIAVFTGAMLNTQSEGRKISKFNKEYEQYTEKTVLGSDVATVINKAINNNENNGVPKDEKKFYIDNKKNSIKIYIKLEEKGDYYNMETIAEHDIGEFVKNFSLEDFKCTKINYHESTKQVSTMYFDII